VRPREYEPHSRAGGTPAHTARGGAELTCGTTAATAIHVSHTRAPRVSIVVPTYIATQKQGDLLDETLATVDD
jgi:hypothetical protein